MNNPYAAPNAALSEAAPDDQVYQPKIFALRGRIGRLRYLAYSFFLMGVCSVFPAIVAALIPPSLAAISRSNILWASTIGLMYLPMIVITVIMAKRRLNDLDRSGWLGILMLLPLVNFFLGLYLMFGPGTPGGNRYGAPPAGNSVPVVLAGLVLPLLFSLGIVAAIAIPAFQAYKARTSHSGAAPAAVWLETNFHGRVLSTPAKLSYHA